MDREDILLNLVSEMRRGTLVLCVLASLDEPTYGYSLIEELSDTGLAIEANTLYPLLRRLESQGLLEATWNTDGAKPRKYYSLTALGGQVLTELTTQWQATVAAMNAILKETN